MAILIVEDDAGVSQTLSSILREEGYDVAQVADGLEAVAYLDQNAPPELILLDLMMPNMDGVQLKARLIRDQKLAAIPVIVVSARPDVGRVAKHMGADGFLGKPMSFEELLHVVQNRAITARNKM
jgi:CheY-like chemotaxis protein